MSPGDIVVIAILVVIVALCIRSLIKQKKNGGCSGNCAGCSHCQSGSVNNGEKCNCKK